MNNFRSWEPESDSSFECSMAFQHGKKLYCYMDDISIMRERVPNLGPDFGWRDICGCNAENFNYSLSLIFVSSVYNIIDCVYKVVDKICADLFAVSE